MNKWHCNVESYTNISQENQNCKDKSKKAKNMTGSASKYTQFSETQSNSNEILLDLDDPPEGIIKTSIVPFQFNLVQANIMSTMEETFGLDLSKSQQKKIVLEEKESKCPHLLSNKKEGIKTLEIHCTLSDLVTDDDDTVIKSGFIHIPQVQQQHQRQSNKLCNPIFSFADFIEEEKNSRNMS